MNTQKNSTTPSLKFVCPKKWDSMSPANGGRQCDSCNKVVRDFSAIPVNELNKALSCNTEKKLCGNFKAYQLDKPFGNGKDKIISFYQRILNDKFRFNMLKPVTLLFIMGVMFLTGCRVFIRGKVVA